MFQKEVLIHKQLYKLKMNPSLKYTHFILRYKMIKENSNVCKEFLKPLYYIGFMIELNKNKTLSKFN